SDLLLDGHIVLDRRLAERDHFPAINVARSVSRVFHEVTDPSHRTAARKLRAIMSTYADVEDLIRIGSYRRGANAQIDRVIELMPRVNQFLRQDRNAFASFEETRRQMDLLAAAWPE
ncbi:MAG: EscN/YscN/HrcN family type III secretion system ATPase, partial [Planctomycetes bacterium]|nr:EscN/YscN/HrcN family type III secretion system ATPase [Planctomycetota bacterium]